MRMNKHKEKFENLKLSAINAVANKNYLKFPPIFSRADLGQFETSYKMTGSVFITGSCGTGKTHLAAALIKDYYARGVKEIEYDSYVQNENIITEKLSTFGFVNFQELVIGVKSSFRKESISMDNIINAHLKGIRLFDDIGTNKPTDVTVETLYMILNKRYENELKTIYTSNLSVQEIAKTYGDRIASRLSSFEQIRLTGDDRRLKKMNEGKASPQMNEFSEPKPVTRAFVEY